MRLRDAQDIIQQREAEAHEWWGGFATGALTIAIVCAVGVACLFFVGCQGPPRVIQQGRYGWVTGPHPDGRWVAHTSAYGHHIATHTAYSEAEAQAQVEFFTRSRP